jgi:hypothetical protein
VTDRAQQHPLEGTSASGADHDQTGSGRGVDQSGFRRAVLDAGRDGQPGVCRPQPATDVEPSTDRPPNSELKLDKLFQL